MTLPSRFVVLSNLMGSYFNQDFGFDGKDESETLKEFAATQGPERIAQAVAEIDVLLSYPTYDLHEVFARQTGAWEMPIGNNGEEARAWLTRARAVFVERDEAH